MDKMGLSRTTIRRLAWGGVAIYGILPPLLALVLSSDWLLLIAAIWVVTLSEVITAVMMMLSYGIISTEEDRKEAVTLTMAVLVFAAAHLWMYGQIYR